MVAKDIRFKMLLDGIQENNNPLNMSHLGAARQVFKENADTDYAVYSPDKLPKVLKMPRDFCTTSPKNKFVLSGRFKNKKWTKPPEIVFKSNNKTNHLFLWGPGYFL